MIIVQLRSGETVEFNTARRYNFYSFGRYLRLYDYLDINVAVFKTSEIIGFWER